ncbi:MAG: hypothetical protein HYY84_19885 [Deltaproteobacteria bacterium]|nr:hypothetical protein [Deltaproteobacteria bacterium]
MIGVSAVVWGLGLAVGGASEVKVQPYGVVWTNFFYNVGSVNNIDIPFLSTASTGSDTFGATARQTRVGLKASIPKVWGGATIKGHFESDFFAGSANSAFQASKPIPRIRIASIALEWERARVLVGQDWTIFAPLNPASLAHASIPGFAATGNLWDRAPQIRFEWWRGSGALKYGVQAALYAPVDNELFSGATVADQTYAVFRSADPIGLSRLPGGQARLWFGLDMPSGKQGVLGIASHTHFERYFFEGGAETLLQASGVAVDVALPVTKWLSLSGEFFFGKNLESFMGGAMQGVKKTTAAASDGSGKTVLTSTREIGTMGGWAQLSLAPTSVWSFHFGYGIDQPNEDDIATKTRSRNTAGYVGIGITPHEKLKFAVEYNWLETQSKGATIQTGHHFNLGASLDF